MATVYLHPALIGGRVYLAPLVAPSVVVIPDPDPDPGTDPPIDPPIIPVGAPQLYAATIMRRSIINLTGTLGPASINLTARLS